MRSKIDLPRFSLQERDRRYAAVRAKMAELGVDCLVIPHNTGDWDNYQPDVRYLTGIGGYGTAAAAVFPIEGEPIAICRDAGRVEWWKHAQNWVKETRGKKGEWSESLAQAVRDVGHENGRIGVVGLKDMRRDPQGIVSYYEWQQVLEELPEAQFEDVTKMMQGVRQQMSAEEVAFVERAAEIGDAASLALFETARVGVSEHEVYAAMTAAMIRNGGETPTMGLFVADQEPDGAYLMPTIRTLEPNDVIITEFDPKYGGYMAQSDETVCVGTPNEEWERLYQVSLDCFNIALEAIKPGVPWLDVSRLVQERIKKENKGYGGGGLGHAMGLAEDPPSPGPNSPPDELILEGQCMILKAGVSNADRTRTNRAGNTIIVEKNGARRLGKLEMKMRRL